MNGVVTKKEIVEYNDFLYDLSFNDDHCFWIKTKIDGKSYLTHNSDPPDVDCLWEETAIIVKNKGIILLREVVIGDIVYDINNDEQIVENIYIRDNNENDIIIKLSIINNNEKSWIICNDKHKLIDSYGNEILAKDLHIDDKLFINNTSCAKIYNIENINNKIKLIDIQTSGTHTFQIIPYAY